MNNIIKATKQEVKESPFGFKHLVKKTPKYLSRAGLTLTLIGGVVTLFTPVKWAIAAGMVGNFLTQMYGKKAS